MRSFAVAIVLLMAVPAWGQRVQFPSMIFQPAPSGGVPPAAFETTPQPTWDPYADPNGPPPTYAPAATPYYTPGPQSPGPYQEGAPAMFPQGYPPGGSMYSRATRLLQEFRVQDTWLPGGDDPDDLGINSVELSATFAYPFLYNQSPLLVTPGAAVHWWDGPESVGPGSADLPPRTYDVFVDLAWHPQVTERLHAELGFRTGLYTDFENMDSDSVRFMGRALGVVTTSPTTQIKLGAIYIDRNETGLLPAGGVVYTPNADTRLEILFPRPKLAMRLTTVGNTSVWGYLAGEYGGGSWTIDRADSSSDSFDYNDLRVILGAEFLPETLSGRKGLVEIGYVFDREIDYESDSPDRFEPPDTFMLRAGVSF